MSMRIFKSISPPALACLTFLTIAMAFDVHAQAGDEPSQARLKVYEFETRIYQKIHGNNGTDSTLRDSEETRNSIRHFFAGLENSGQRLEAIGMLDSRYEYIVTPGIAAELLGPLIRDADPTVRARAARAIGYNGCGAQYATELIAMLEGDPTADALINVARAMGTSGHQPFVPHLEKMLGNANHEVRSNASSALTRLAPMTAFNHNLRLLEDEAPSVRSAAIENIAHPPGNVIVTSLMRMLNDKDPAVRETAVRVLGEMNVTTSADAIRERLSDENHHVRAQAALVLGQMRQHSWDVAALLKDRDVVVRRKAAIAMGLMAAPRYIENLRPLLNDEDDQVREYAWKSISQLAPIPQP